VLETPDLVNHVVADLFFHLALNELDGQPRSFRREAGAVETVHLTPISSAT